MAYTPEALIEKLHEMYPEVKAHHIDISMVLDQAKKAWVITMKKDSHTLSTFLDIADADACMEGDRCVYLGLHIGEFVENFETHET